MRYSDLAGAGRRAARYRAAECLLLPEDFFIPPAARAEWSRAAGAYRRDKEWEPGLKHAVQVDGQPELPGGRRQRLTVEFALPWEGLRALATRIPHRAMAMCGALGRPAASTSHDAQGNNTSVVVVNRHGYINMHILERWTAVTFLDEVVWRCESWWVALAMNQTRSRHS